MLQACRQEWDKREGMEQAELDRMRQVRAVYEAELEAANDPALRGAAAKGNEGDKNKGDKKPAKKKGKEKKGAEPPMITELTTVNMTEQFLAADEAKHQKIMQKMHPDDGLVLKSTEVCAFECVYICK